MERQREPPPSPLAMEADDIRRVAGFLANARDGTQAEDHRLLIEILDCLRSIDDKLERLLSREPR